MRNLTECKRIGFLGGTFDPVHNGHLAVARHVTQVLALDMVWFIPASLPPHKTVHEDGQQISSFNHRLSMLERALHPYPLFTISDIEARRSAPSYSIDTLHILRQRAGEEADLYFIIGADAFLEIDTWKQYRELPIQAGFVIISRPGFPPGEVKKKISKVFPDYEYDPAQEQWRSPVSRGTFTLQQMEPVPISSTMIRKRVRKQQPLADLVPPAVEEYIREQKLYRN